MKKKECHIIPQEEKQCVWMTSGLISYKLCTLDYHCEECIFDQVIRNEAVAESALRTVSTTQPAQSSPDKDSFLRNQSALFHHPGHCWAKVESTEDVWVGIDGILACLLSKVKAVALPDAGEEVRQGECFAHIIQEKHIMPLYSPVTGSVVFVNRETERKPEILISNFWNKAWLIRVKPDKLENDLRALMFGKKASQWYQKKENDVMESSLSMIQASNHSIGATMQDGGERITHLADILSPEQYCHILEIISGAEES